MTYDQQVLAKLIRRGEPLTESEWRDVGRFLHQFLKECETNQLRRNPARARAVS